MKQRFLYLLLPIITLILEILPYGAVCVFAPSPTEQVKKTFSYFDIHHLVMQISHLSLPLLSLA